MMTTEIETKPAAATRRSASMRVGAVRRLRASDGTETVWAEIATAEKCYQVRFRVRGARAADGADAFVPAALLPAMRAGAALDLDGPVSPRLLAATSAVQEVVSGWHESFKPVPVAAPPAPAAAPAPG